MVKKGMPKKPCRKSGCPNLVSDGSGFCADHQEVRRDRAKKTEPFYCTAAWQRARSIKRKNSPLCEACLSNGKTVAAQMVDHIIEIKEGGAKLAQSNLQSLCFDCHNKKTHGKS
jgi:5-methylcytosine-specific restriction protein A